MANRNPTIAKKNVTIRWRKQKELCLRCGQNIHEGDCEEDYEKADLRNIDVVQPVKEVDQDKKKNTVISYRKRKDLCLHCGKNLHGSSECSEPDYTIADNRSDEEKVIDPRTVSTPKPKDDKEDTDTTIELEKTSDTTYSRDIILIDTRENGYQERIDFIDIRYLAKKYQDYIICVIGDIEGSYPYADVLEMKKIINLLFLGDEHIDDQLIINHIWGCKMFFSYQSEFTKYAKKHGLNCISFPVKSNVRNIITRIKNDR